MFISSLPACRFPTVMAILLSSAVQAQTAKPSTPQMPMASAFEGYKPYTDEPIGNWKAANETAARIGGWREYARQAQGLDSKPDNMPAAQPAQAAPNSAAKVKP